MLLYGTSARCALGATHSTRLCRAAEGATFAASLESELSDSAMLGYLRRARFACCGTRRKSLHPAKAKKRKPSKWMAFFLAEMERFELLFYP